MPINPMLTQGVPVGPPPQEISFDASELQPPLEDIVYDFSDVPAEEPQFADNLAEFMSETDLKTVALDLVAKYEADRTSRKDWEQTYIKGLDLLGLKFEERSTPWDGACGVFHPLLTESVVRFQAQTIQEIFPAKGPAKAKIEGSMTPDRVKQQQRVVGFLNYLATCKMPEYRSETETLLFSLPIAGSAFRKVFYDPNKNRPAASFIPAEDFVVAYGTSDLDDCERATHVMKKTENEVKKLQVKGWYRDVDLGESSPETSEVEDAINKMIGVHESYDYDDRHTILEMQVDYSLPGFEDPDDIKLPYVIAIDFSSGEILSIRRNWEEGDETKERHQHYVHYKYLPGPGFYGLGLVHVIGGITKSATSILRQLVDAGTLANLPGGLKARGLKIKGDDTPIMPGEFRDVDVYSGTIKDNLTFLPHKEPSTVLYQLLGDLVEEGRRFASAADVKAADMNAEAPVGTTLAILEREMKVMSAVQARIHYALGKELLLISDIVQSMGIQQYPYDVGGNFSPAQDFDERVDIIPVSDPNAGTMAQRIMQYQAALQLSATAPEIYDVPYLHRQMLEVLGIEGADKIVPTEDDMEPSDPVSENMALINGKPVKAFEYQDHEAHIKTHMAMGQNPQLIKMMEGNPRAEQIMQSGYAHINEHVAFLYRRKVEQELGFELPDGPLPEDIEHRISGLIANAADQLTGKAQQQAQAEENARKQEDPIIQLQEREMALEERKQASKEQESLVKLRNDMQKHLDKMMNEDADRAHERDMKSADIASEMSQTQSHERIEGFRKGIEMIEKQLDSMNERE